MYLNSRPKEFPQRSTNEDIRVKCSSTQETKTMKKLELAAGSRMRLAKT